MPPKDTKEFVTEERIGLIKLIGLFLGVGTLIASTVWAVSGIDAKTKVIETSVTNLKVDHEQYKESTKETINSFKVQVEKDNSRQDAEISSLKSHTDALDRTATEMNGKLDTVVAILQRLEKRVDEKQEGK